MITAVIPAQNEEKRIGFVIRSALEAEIDRIFVIINGSRDRTYDEVESLGDSRIKSYVFRESLGIDVPRAIGAFESYKIGANTVVFVDGDMIGNITPILRNLIYSIEVLGSDLALTNCYPKIPSSYGLSTYILNFRYMLNETLGIYSQVGVSSPSHGPHAVSRRLLETIPFREMAVPPVVLALAVKSNLKIHVSSTIPHYKLGSKTKNPKHAEKIAETIIGDCLEAICVYLGKDRHRFFEGHEYIGYHDERRWDILEEYIKESSV